MPVSASASVAACMLAGTTLLTCLAAAAPGFPRHDAMHARREAADVDVHVDAGSYTHPMSRRAQPDLGSQLTSVDVMPGDDVATPGHPGRSLLHPRTNSCHRRQCGPISLTGHAYATLRPQETNGCLRYACLCCYRIRVCSFTSWLSVITDRRQIPPPTAEAEI